MTIYQYETPFVYNEQKEYVCSSVDKKSECCVRVTCCMFECLNHHLGHDYINNSSYSPQKWLYIDKDNNVTIEQGESCGMGHLYCLLDNFNSYYGGVEDEKTITILSVGSSLTHNDEKHGYFNYETFSHGFGIVINKLTNDITLVALGEDDGNYWGDCEMPYENLSKYDRNVIISIINDIDESHFYNKNELIEKLWHG